MSRRTVTSAPRTGRRTTATGIGLAYVTLPQLVHVRGQVVAANAAPQYEQCEPLVPVAQLGSTVRRFSMREPQDVGTFPSQRSHCP